MPRKKKDENLNGVQAHVDEDGYMRLSGDLLWKWRALDAELRAAISELEMVNQLIQVEVSKNPELSSAFQKKAALTGAISVAKGELVGVQQEIENTLGVSLKECAFDDKTGRLYHLGTDGSRGEPVKPKSRAKRKAVSA